MKKLILLATALLAGGILLLGAAPSAQAARWAEPYLQNLVDREIMKGDKDGSLNPDRLITRAEFAALVNRAFGFTAQSNKTFSDVKPTSWYAADISIAANQGYMVGNGKGANPTGNLTREEAVAMLCRALKIPEVKQDEFTLNDEKTFSNWSRGYINAALDRSFVNGYPDSTFRPKNYITRGEAAKMLSDVGGEIVNKTNNNAHGTINGNLTIASSGVTISDTTIMGDVFLTEGVGLGYVHLNNVSINGELIISGAGESNVGESSVTLSDCTITDLTVDVAKLKILTLKTDRSTTVRNAMIKSSAYLEELTDNYEGFDRVTLNGPSGTFLNLTGNFGDVRIMSPEAKLGLYKGQANGITVDETAKNAKIFLEKDTITEAIYFDTGAAVTGTGRIRNVLINNDGVTIDQLPDNIYIRPGVTAKINGKVMGSLDAETEALNPEFMAGYPMADKIQPTSFNEYYKTNKAGKIYYALYAADMPAPSKDDLIAKNNPPKNALKSGNLSSLPDKESTVAFSGLKAGNKYVVYSLFVDLRNKTSNIERTNVETVDNIVPTLLSGYPKVGEMRSDGATIELIPNKDTHYYWAVLPDKTVAPTVEQLYNQKLSGDVAKGINRDGKLNTTNTISISGLEEFKTYVFYVVLRDTAENMSKTAYKISFTTKDATAPEFEQSEIYPKAGVVTDTAIPIEYMVSEPCTVYWSVAKEGTEVLPKLTNGLDYTSQKARDIIKGGTYATKFGKVTASKEKTKYTFSISGLEKQMPYDIYFVLEDKQGNQSDVVAIKAKTKDSTAPTVSVTSEQILNDKFSVDSPIIMTFSEIVCGIDDAETGPKRFSTMFAEKKTALEDYLKLWDTTQVPAQEVTIDWDKVDVKDVDAKTVITFQLGAISMLNNNGYRFDLASRPGYYIRDTSKNQLKMPTQLSFATSPPLTYFTEVTNFNADEFHSAFLLRPQAQKTGQYIFFDMLIQSDQKIEFELWTSKDMRNFDQVGGDGKTFVIQENYVTSINDLTKESVAYRDIKERYYAINLKKVGSTTIGSPIPLTVNVNLTVHALIGDQNALNGLPGDVKIFEKNLKDQISKGKISIVTAPTEPFNLFINLVDQQPPKLEINPPTFVEGDTQILMRIKPTKGCTVYYYMVPFEIKPANTPDPYQIRTATSNASLGTAAGKFVVGDNETVPTEHTVKGLIAPPVGHTQRYVLYLYLQGKAPDPSEVYVFGLEDTKPLQTHPVDRPILDTKTFQWTPGGGMVTVNGTWDQDCKMYYIVYPDTTYPGNSKPADISKVMEAQYPDALKEQSSKVVKKGESFELKIYGLEYTKRYDIFVAAQRFVGEEPAGEPSIVYQLERMAPLDNIPPAVSDKSPSTTLTKVSTDKQRYSGTVTINFTEGLYYFNQGSSEKHPLTVDALKEEGFVETSLPSDSTSTSKITITGTGTTEITEPTEPPTKVKCVDYVKFDFKDIYNGTTIVFTKSIGDTALNMAGQFKMTFRVNREEGKEWDSAWVAEFIPPKS